MKELSHPPVLAFLPKSNNAMEGVILKVAGRCNLNCTYCYMYNKGDLSFLNQPKVMHQETLIRALDRVDEYISQNTLLFFQFILHGGEPLILGVETMESFLDEIHRRFTDRVELSLSVQTNGTLLTEKFCELFNRYDVRVSISLDGEKKINDLNRVDFKGNSSFYRTLDGVQMAQKRLNVPPAILSVVQVNESPHRVYDFFKGLGVKDWDVLLPDHNHDSITEDSRGISNWLTELFDIWYADKTEKPRIRRFLNIIYLILGKKVKSDTLGLELNKLLVIETDGEIEPIDVLKIEGHNFTKTNLNVFENDFEEAFQNPLIRLYTESNRKVTRLCRKCIIYPVCGGGYLPHRYSKKDSFNNRTIYCYDLMKLITHIQNRVLEDIREGTLREAGVRKYTFGEVYASANSG